MPYKSPIWAKVCDFKIYNITEFAVIMFSGESQTCSLFYMSILLNWSPSPANPLPTLRSWIRYTSNVCKNVIMWDMCKYFINPTARRKGGQALRVIWIKPRLICFIHALRLRRLFLMDIVYRTGACHIPRFLSTARARNSCRHRGTSFSFPSTLHVFGECRPTCNQDLPAVASIWPLTVVLQWTKWYSIK